MTGRSHDAGFDRRGEPDDFIPMFANDVDADRAAEQSFDPFVRGGLLNCAETIILEVSKTRHEAESKEIAQGEDVIARGAGVGVMFLHDQGGSMVQKPVEDMGASPMVAEMILA